MRGRRGVASLLALLLAPVCAQAVHINVATIDGSINPASSDFLQRSIAQSEEDGAAALLIELDTPGGLLAATKDIVQAMLNARVPVIVYVYPRGAWAASAGAFVTLAANIAAMAPGTSIGAASPINATGGGGGRDEQGERTDVGLEKAEKFTTAFIESIAKERHRNVEWAARAVREAEAITAEEALELGVIDLVAADTSELLEKIEGREVQVGRETRVLEVAGAELRRLEMSPVTRLFDFLASPDVAVILVMLGLLGLYIEFNQPGMVLPGVAGLACLVLAGFAFQILPFSWLGLLVLLLGMALIVTELFVTSYGALFAAGLVCLLLGGSMVFDLPEVSDLRVSFWSVLVPVVGAFAVFAALVIVAVGRTFVLRQTAGVDELIGLHGTAVTDLSPQGRIFVRGEYWSATGESDIAREERIEVVAVDGMRLRVRRATDAD